MVMTSDDQQSIGTRLWPPKACCLLCWNQMQEPLHPVTGGSELPIDILFLSYKSRADV